MTCDRLTYNHQTYDRQADLQPPDRPTTAGQTYNRRAYNC